MKFISLITCLLYFDLSFGQNKCSCDSNPTLKEIISCTSIVFKNKAKLFRQFNCDSSWLVFQNKRGKQTVIYALEYPLIELTQRLGYQYAAEYTSSFLIQDNVISGCCDPPDFILFDKEKGLVKRQLGRLIFYSENKKLPIIIYFNNSNYKSFDNSNINFDILTVFNIDKNKKYRITLPKGRIKKTLEFTNEMFAEHLFDASIKGHILTLIYRYETSIKHDNLTAKIVLNMKNY